MMRPFRSRGKNFKYTQKGLELAKTIFSQEEYAKIEASSQRKREQKRISNKVFLRRKKIRFASGEQTEADVQSRLNTYERQKKYRRQKKVINTSQELKNANSAVLAQLKSPKKGGVCARKIETGGTHKKLMK